MIRKYRFSFLIFILMLLFLTACGNSESSSNESEDNGQGNETGIIKVESAIGTTEIKGTPERVVTLYQGATDTAVAMGIKPVGVVESWLQQPIYDYLKDDLEGVPIVGQETQPNLEEIAKLKPDLIIASQVRHEEIFDQLSQIAPTVAHETVFDFKGTVELMGKAMNQEDKSTELLANWDNRVETFKNKIEEEKEWPLSASVLNFREDHARIYVTGFAGSILTELGFAGPKDLTDPNQEIFKLTDKESIPQMNADVFYIFMEEGAAVKKTYEEWTSHPLWNNLDAVNDEQVFIVDEITWNMAGGIVSANLMLDDIFERFEIEE